MKNMKTKEEKALKRFIIRCPKCGHKMFIFHVCPNCGYKDRLLKTKPPRNIFIGKNTDKIKGR